MKFGLFLEFPSPQGGTEHEAFRDAFDLVDRAEEQGVDSVWLAEYHFNPGRVLASPVTISSAVGRVFGHSVPQPLLGKQSAFPGLRVG